MRDLIFGSNYKLVNWRVSQIKKSFTGNYKVQHSNDDSFPLYQALLSESLFAEQSNLVIDISEISNNEVDLLLKINKPSSTNIVIYAEKLDKAKLTKLSKFFEVEEYSAPANKAEVRKLLFSYAKEQDVALPQNSFDYLYERFANNIDSYYNIIDQLNIGSIQAPTEQQIAYLTTENDKIVAPWDVLNKLVKKNFTTYLNQINQLEFMPLCYYLSNRFVEIALLKDDPSRESEINAYTLNTLRPLLSITKDLDLDWILTGFAEIEYQLKNGSLSAAFEFELFLVKINKYLLNI